MSAGLKVSEIQEKPSSMVVLATKIRSTSVISEGERVDTNTQTDLYSAVT